MKFLETITWLGHDVLIPINRIKHVLFSCQEGYRIKITSDDGDWEEFFGEDREKADFRYEMIKKIIKGG